MSMRMLALSEESTSAEATPQEIGQHGLRIFRAVGQRECIQDLLADTGGRLARAKGGNLSAKGAGSRTRRPS